MGEQNMMVVEPVMKPVIPATLLKIKPGFSCLFRTRDFSPLGSVSAAIFRLNQQGENFAVTQKFNNGESYIVHREAQQK